MGRYGTRCRLRPGQPAARRGTGRADDAVAVPTDDPALRESAVPACRAHPGVRPTGCRVPRRYRAIGGRGAGWSARRLPRPGRVLVGEARGTAPRPCSGARSGTGDRVPRVLRPGRNCARGVRTLVRAHGEVWSGLACLAGTSAAPALTAGGRLRGRARGP